MYLTGFCGSSNFALEKLNLNFNDFYIIFLLTGMDSFSGKKFYYNFIKLYCLKKNIIIFQFKNKFIYNNLLIFNNYLFFIIKKFDRFFINVFDYGFLFSLNFINFTNYIINLHGSLLLSFKGCCPILGNIIFSNIILGFNVIYLNKYIDSGRKLNLYKIYKKFNYNYNIIKYNFSLISGIYIKKILYYHLALQKFFRFNHMKFFNFVFVKD